MTAELSSALFECRFKRGCLDGTIDPKAPDGRLLRLCTRQGKPYRTYRLAWSDYFAAYCLWQELNAKWVKKKIVREAA